MRRPTRLLAFALAGALLSAPLAGCLPGDDTADEDTAPPPRPVRTMTVGAGAGGGAASPAFAGRIEAADQVSLAFRIGGRLATRDVEVGTALAAGDPIAALEPQNERNAVRSAEAALIAAEAAFVRADNAFERHRELLRRGVTAQAYFEGVQQARTAAEAEVTAARARLAIAQDRLGFTTLSADAPGIVTAVGAEPGEVVAAGETIARLAREDGRDGVFDVSSQALDALGPGATVRVTLTGDETVAAFGRVREVAPQADPVTRTFRVRVGLVDPPAGLRLGAGVTGTVVGAAEAGVTVPLGALVAGRDAVFVVDPATQTIALRPVEVAARDGLSARITGGLVEGDVVVTAGTSVLADGQAVRFSGARS